MLTNVDTLIGLIISTILILALIIFIKKQTKQTNLKKYGVEWCLQLPKVNAMRNCKDIRNKMENTLN